MQRSLYRYKYRLRNERTSFLGVAMITSAVLLVVIAFGMMVSIIPNARAATNHEIGMYDYYFSPKFITIAPGDTVTWHNFSPYTTHTATSNTSAWPEKTVTTGSTSSPITLTTPGNYTYICSIHFPLGFNMWGAIVVESSTVPEFPSAMPIIAGFIVIMLGMMLLGGIRTKDGP